MIHIAHTPQRGFTLLVAVVLGSVALSVGLALLDITYRQTLLASASKQSQVAFYNADAGLECALYYDQQQDFFGANPFGFNAGNVTCDGEAMQSFTQSGTAPKISEFTFPCAGGTGVRSKITVYKNDSGTFPNKIYSKGYNNCDQNNSRLIERGLKVMY